MLGPQLSTGLRGPVYFFLGALLLWLAAAGTVSATELLTLQLRLGSKVITAEVAADEASRSQGLMFREALPTDHGMVFVFRKADQYCFWMKNTPLPLTIAFIGADGRIINLADMQALSLDTHCALAPALYALEMEQGWFQRHELGPGAQVQGLPAGIPRAEPGAD